MTLRELFVVPSERHVERLAREGRRAETRSSLQARLATAFCPDIRFSDPSETRLSLAVGLSDARTRGQLDLFGGSKDDPLLATLRGRGGASWVRAVAAIDEAIGILRLRGASETHLDRVRGGVAAARAQTLAAAIRALDETLSRSGARDGRLLGAHLAPALRAAGADAVVDVLGAEVVRARWILAWDPPDLGWWRALDETLSVRSPRGFARVILPSFDKRLSGSRERDPLELLADAAARQLDAAPETEAIPAVLGDLAATPPDVALLENIHVFTAAHARDEAALVARIIRRALEAGTPIERIVIAYPVRDERVLLPLGRALDVSGIVFHDALGDPPSSVPVVAAALHALVAAETLDRSDVARLLRGGYLDAPRLLADPRVSFQDAERTLARLARALETRATRAGEGAALRLVATAADPGSEDEPAARYVVGLLEQARAAETRGERVQAARTLFRELGVAARAGRGARAAFARDEAPVGVDRAERLAVARDVRAWESMASALDDYETSARRLGAEKRPVDAEVFRLELTEMLDRGANRPHAGRAGAVRFMRLADVAGEPLDLLVVLDANDGVLPRDAPSISLVSESLEAGIARVAREAFVPRPASEVMARDLAALAMSAAEARSVVFVTTAEDSTGAPRTPSRIVLALGRAPSAGTASRSAVSSEGPRLEARGSLRGPVEVARRIARERVREGFFLDASRPLSPMVGALEGADASRALIALETGSVIERALAVTSIERFAQCPFKGYAHVVLAAREGEEQRELPDAREEGNLGHAALAAAFTAALEQWPDRPRDAESILARGLEAADATLRASEGHAPLRALVRLRVRESVRALLRRAIDDEEWDFAFAEQAFGRGRPWPAFLVEDVSSGESLWLRGTIDRIDRGHGRALARVVDYKRSKSTVKDSAALLGETALQVPIYAAVTARQLEMPATGTYLPMQPRDLAAETKSARAGKSSPEERVSELSRRPTRAEPSEIERRVLALVSSARSGLLAPLPAREADCTYCAVSGGCRKPRFAMAPAEEDEPTSP